MDKINKNSLIRLDKNSFIRIYENGKYGYINSQLSYHDRIYNETGADFLAQIKRTPRRIRDIIKSLSCIYGKVDTSTIEDEFLRFAISLQKSRFVIIGNTKEDLDAYDTEFSYSMTNPKTFVDVFPQESDIEPELDTETFYLQHDKISPRLTNLQLELTNRCNERCIHCYIPNKHKDVGFDMPLTLVTKALEEFAEMGGLHVTLSGGEALLHKDIIKILRFCRKKDLQISFLSNLIRLTEEHVKVLKEVNVSLIQVSLYSMNPNIHDQITTVKGSFEKTKNAIELLREADIPVQISCPIMKANKVGYDKVLEYARSLRIKAQTDYIMMAQSDCDTANLANRISIEDTRQVIEDILNHDKQYDELMSEVKPIKALPIEEYKELPLCGAGLNELCIASNGNAFPCAGWQAYVVGNLNNQSLECIWKDSPELNFIRKISRKNFPKCMTCPDREYCSICLVRNYNESNGDMFCINEHNCKVAHLNRTMVESRKGNVWALKS